jgi:hypothetical protein
VSESIYIPEPIGGESEVYLTGSWLIRPTKGRVVSEGEPKHQHTYRFRPWDNRYGKRGSLDPEVLDGAISRDLFGSECGRQIILQENHRSD